MWIILPPIGITDSRNLEVAAGLTAWRAAIPLAEIARFIDREETASLEDEERVSGRA